MMTGAVDAARAACRQALDEGAVAGHLEPGQLATLARAPAQALDGALRDFADTRGAGALQTLQTLAAIPMDRRLRRTAKRALYRLAQRGIAPEPATASPRPVVMRERERATRAWVSAIDGTGARALWIVFEGGFGGLELASVIVSDTTGIVEAAGGSITRKRLDTELERLREEQQLPWVEIDPERALGLVAEALLRHAELRTSPPPEFERWRARIERVTAVTPPVPPATIDPGLVDRSATLLDLPEMQGWFIEPADVHAEGLELLEARESRLVVPDQIKAEREEAVVSRVVERTFDGAERQRWARRLLETALLFRALDRTGEALMAEAAAAALADTGSDPMRHPFVRGLARRALAVAGDIALGRISAADVSRVPRPVTRR
jgi:hypothetical protein